MANSKIKTLWTIAGRVKDSREVLDSNGGMLGGRIDIPASQAVKAEGYDFIEYRTTLSDGSVMTHTDFQQWIGSLKGVVESKPGSGVMTVYIPRESAPSDFGIFQLDVYKEWNDVDPEPEPEPANSIVRVVGSYHSEGFGFNAYHVDGVRTSIQYRAFDVNLALPKTETIIDIEKRLKALEGKPTA